MTQKAQTVIRYTVATHAAEKMIPSRKALRLCEKIADGHISADHAVEKIKWNYGLRATDSIYDTASLKSILRRCLVKE